MTEIPPVNPNIHDIADRAKFGYARGTEVLASAQRRLAELACTGQLDHEESIRLQHSMVLVWEALYDGTLCAVRDYSTSQHTWDDADNTYSDGRQVVIRNRFIIGKKHSHLWKYEKFLLRDGAPTEFPVDVFAVVQPLRRSLTPRSQVPGSSKYASFFDRLRQYRRD